MLVDVMVSSLTYAGVIQIVVKLVFLQFLILLLIVILGRRGGLRLRL